MYFRDITLVSTAIAKSPLPESHKCCKDWPLSRTPHLSFCWIRNGYWAARGYCL